MTESEWLTCTDPRPMLEFLRGKASDRRLRLFAVACCRLIWPLMTDERSRRAVEVAERFADGMANKHEWRLAAIGARAVTEDVKGAVSPAAKARSMSASAALFATLKKDAALYSASSTASANYFHLGSTISAENTTQADLLRCIIGDPFRSITPSPSWLAWNDGTVHKLAQVIYDDRAFDRLPLLADALEDAGCTDAAILSHCREQGEHVRGCWVVDLLLGKS